MQESEKRGVTAYLRATAAVPLVGERPPLGVRAVGVGEQVLAQDPVGEHQAARHPQPDPVGLGEQRIHGGREVGPEDQRGGGAGAREAVDEVGGDPGGVRRVGQAGLLGERATFEPVEQRHAEAADRAHLRVVHVGVDEPREHESLAQVDDLVVRVLAEELVGRSAGGDHAVADEQGGVGLRAQVVATERALRGVDEGAAEERHR